VAKTFPVRGSIARHGPALPMATYETRMPKPTTTMARSNHAKRDGAPVGRSLSGANAP
jgi:hypothetical protein